MVRSEPEAVMICCSFVPANCPNIACVIAEGGLMVKAYINIEDVVAMMWVDLKHRVPLLELSTSSDISQDSPVRHFEVVYLTNGEGSA